MTDHTTATEGADPAAGNTPATAELAFRMGLALGRIEGKLDSLLNRHTPAPGGHNTDTTTHRKGN